MSRSAAGWMVALAVLWCPTPGLAAPPLGDFTVPTNHVPDFFPMSIPVVDTTGWAEYSLTDAGDAAALGCTAATVNDSTDDADNIACYTLAAPAQSIVYLPAGTYDLDSETGLNTSFYLAKSQQVIRGAGIGQTILASSQTHFIMGTNNSDGSALGSTVSWTAGYARGTQVLTVASTATFTSGNWVELYADANTTLDVVDTLKYHALLTCSGGVGSDCTMTGAGQIRIDRPLRIDYNTGNQTARPWTPYTSCGVEHLTMQYDDPSAAIHNSSGGAWFESLANCWIVGVDFANAHNLFINVQDSARVLVHGTRFGVLARENAWQKAGIRTLNTTDMELSNSVFYNAPVVLQVAAMTDGLIIAYNRMLRPTNATVNWCERSVFIHGGPAVDMLVEGNDFDCGLQWDAQQGPAGHRVVLYRNRGRVAGSDYTAEAGGTTNNFDGGFSYHADYPAPGDWAANGWSTNTKLIDWFIAGNNILGLGYQVAGQPGTGVNATSTDMTIDRNIIRGVCTLEDAALYTADCSDEAEHANQPNEGTGTDWGTNSVVTDEAPAGWNSFSAPASLAYGTSAPNWWCGNAVAWGSTGTTGIGLGDDFDESVKKLPAQILYEGGTCSPLGGFTGGTLTGGSLQ